MKKTVKKKIKLTLFDVLLYVFMFLVTIAVLYPFWNVFITSFSDPVFSTSLGLRLWLKDWHLDAYKYILNEKVLYAYGKHHIQDRRWNFSCGDSHHAVRIPAFQKRTAVSKRIYSVLSRCDVFQRGAHPNVSAYKEPRPDRQEMGANTPQSA